MQKLDDEKKREIKLFTNFKDSEAIKMILRIESSSSSKLDELSRPNWVKLIRFQFAIKFENALWGQIESVRIAWSNF